jgi:large subunit ribosomal protein L25
MEKVVLKATNREIRGKQVKALRREGKLPAVIYGRHTEPVKISLDAHTAIMVLTKVGSSTLVTIDVDGQEYPVLVRERQRNYIKGGLIHVDFLAVSLTEKLHAEVRIELAGTSLAVKDFNAVLVTGLHSLSVECLPADLPEFITVDIAPLVKVGDGIHVRDISLGDNVRIMNDPDDMIVNATYAKIEVEEAPVAAEGAVAVAAEGVEPELSVERGKKEDEASEAGAKAEKTEKGAKAEKTEKAEKKK